MQVFQIQLVAMKDLLEVATIHHGALPDDFLPSLGLDFLKNVYYPAAMSSAFAATLVAKSKDRIAGFITVAHDSPRFTRDVLKGKWLRIARYVLRSILVQPIILLRSVEVLWSMLFSKPDPVKAEIVFIAVAPEFQRQGIGRQLVAAAVKYLMKHHEPICRTKTLASNHDVITMYQTMGWRVRDAFRLIGRDYVNLVSG